MITGNVKDKFFEQQASMLPKPLCDALHYLKDTDLANHEPGKFEINLGGVDMILQVLDQVTAPRETLRPEIHRKNIDVQFLAAGGPEDAGFYPDDGTGIVEEDLLESPRDILLYKTDDTVREGRIRLDVGTYAVYLPWDVHIPAIQAGSEPAPIRKIVLKVPMEACLPYAELASYKKLREEEIAKSTADAAVHCPLTGDTSSDVTAPLNEDPTGIARHLLTLSQKTKEARLTAVEEVLKAEGIPYRKQTAAPEKEHPQGVVNFLFETAGSDIDAPIFLFCAHHDAVAGSFGANDNAASICILIDLFKRLSKEGTRAQFALLDGEESGHTGARVLLKEFSDTTQIQGIINLDVCGYGDTIVLCGKGHEKKAPLSRFANADLLSAHNAQVVKFLPESDDIVLRKKFPTLNLAIIPRWDVQYLKAMAAQGEGLLGRTPEFRMMEGDMEVASTMHGGYRDNPDWVEPQAMQKVLDYLAEGLNSADKKKKFWPFS